MNIYVIYKFDDYKIVKDILSKIKEEIDECNSIFMFEPDCNNKNWHSRALQKLKDSQLVVLFDSLSGERNSVGKHISWEVKKAERLGKRIVVFKADPDSQDRSWYEYDYSEQDPMHSRFQTFPLSEAADFLKRECGWQMDNALLHKTEGNESFTDSEMQLILEQYRIMIETSEKLMERRQETVNLYTTLCTTLIALIGASFAFGNLSICGIILLLSGLILVILCRNWQLSLSSYDLNNNGKFQVINLLEKKLPAEIFECEYRYNKMNGIRSFSSREKVLPRIFTALGIALMIIACAIFVLLIIQKFGLI